MPGTSVTYSANITDPVDGTLPNAAIVWTEDGSTIGNGPTIHHIENAVGSHTITVTATNGDGKSARQSITISVSAPPVKPRPPLVSTQLSTSLSLACEPATSNATTHELTLTATNASGQSASTQVQVITHLG